MDIIREKMRIIHSLKSGSMQNRLDDVYELLDFLSETGEYHLEEIQKEFLKNIEHVIPYVKNFSDARDDLEWPYMAEKIFLGIYPIENIPSHLRDYTKKMYYKNENLQNQEE